MFNISTGFTYRGLSPHKHFGLESFDLEALDRLRAERFTPPDKFGIFDMPGVHNSMHPTATGGGKSRLVWI